MQLRPITDGSVATTGVMSVPSRIFGGALITADGTNNATVVVRRTDANGLQVFKIVTKSPMCVTAPFAMDGADVAHYSVSGTGAAAQFYEWVE
jgi:hypothetical protein